MSSFYDKTFSKFILNPVNRAIVMTVCVIWFVIAAKFTSDLVPTTETEQFLDSDHPLQKSITILNTAFPTAARDRGAVITYTWGVNELDRTGVNQLRDTSYFGEPRFTPDWEFSEECQEHILSFCDEFLVNPDEDHIKSNDKGTSRLVSGKRHKLHAGRRGVMHADNFNH